MQRRKFVIGMGALASGTAAAVGTGAFSSVNAERTVSVTTTEDSEAQLAFKSNRESSEGDRVDVSEGEDGTLEMSFGDINREAVTVFDDIFSVKNNGTETVQLRVANDPGEPGEDPIWGSGVGTDGPMDIKHPDGGSMVGGNFQQTRADGSIELKPGQYLTLTVEIDTRGRGSDSWEDGTIYFEAA